MLSCLYKSKDPTDQKGMKANIISSFELLQLRPHLPAKNLPQLNCVIDYSSADKELSSMIGTLTQEHKIETICKRKSWNSVVSRCSVLK